MTRNEGIASKDYNPNLGLLNPPPKPQENQNHSLTKAKVLLVLDNPRLNKDDQANEITKMIEAYITYFTSSKHSFLED